MQYFSNQFWQGIGLSVLTLFFATACCHAQLQIPKTTGKNVTLDPATELAKQSNGIPTVKLKIDGRNFYGAPLAFDGKSLALLRWDGRVSKLSATKKTQVEIIDRNFLPYTHEELKERLAKEFGDRYSISTTEHYVVVHPHGKTAIWAKPFESLHRSFVQWCTDNGLKPKKPQFPMIAVILRSRRDFDRFMKNELKINNRAIQGFYSHKSNRMVMFDPSAMVRVEDETWLYHDPTIVHEATHQSAFNTGIQNRFSPPPLWMAEGLAMLFEARGFNRSRKFPELKHRVNRKRLNSLRKMGTPLSLPSQITSVISDQRLYETKPVEYYNLAWALTWFLAEERHDQFIRYIRRDAVRKPYTKWTPIDEIELFSKCFGNDMQALQREIGAFYAQHL